MMCRSISKRLATTMSALQETDLQEASRGQSSSCYILAPTLF